MKRSNYRASIITTNQSNCTQANNTSKVLMFKPQPELKPIFLVKDCLLLEFTTWGKNFISYMKSSPLPLPEGSINENLRVNMDPYWYVELQEKGLVDNTTLEMLPTIMDKVSQAIFPIHQRRMEVFDCKQKSDSKTYFMELMDKVRMAEWKTFNEQAAVCHLFMQGCKSEEARKACFKILTDTPAGCTKTLMEKLGEIDACSI